MFLYLVVCIAANSFANQNNSFNKTAKDIDGNLYQTIKIGSQYWFAANLITTRYNDGTSIVTGLGDDDWASTNAGAYAIFPPIPRNINTYEQSLEVYGKYYNWYAVNSAQLCPQNWRVPSSDDWNKLIDYLISNYQHIANSDVANVLKSCRSRRSPLGDACDTNTLPRWDRSRRHYGTDEFGFSALPTGRRETLGGFFTMNLLIGFWWTSTESSERDAYYYSIFPNKGHIYIDKTNKKRGHAIRCMKDVIK